MFRRNRLRPSALLRAGLHQTIFNYPSRSTKRQCSLRQTRNTTTTNIENFDIEFFHKDSIFTFALDQTRTNYLQYKCTQSNCNSTIHVYYDKSIYNIKQINVLGNLHNHDCTYNSSTIFTN